MWSEKQIHKPQNAQLSEEKLERREKEMEQMEQNKTASKMIDFNRTISIITLNVNGPNTLVRRQENIRLDKKARPNCMLSPRNPLI